MNKKRFEKIKNIVMGAAAGLLILVCMCQCDGMTVQAETIGKDGALSQDEALDASSGDSGMGDQDTATEDAGSDESTLGSFTMEEGWFLDDAQSSKTVFVYTQDDKSGVTETSTISCSYIETNYSVQEYEQLRDMLTNNLLYSNVNAQISTSAVYTRAKDYLYIILVDDSSEDYRDIYNYVVGDYQCFCVQVKEYRAEAELAESQDLQTPQEVGQSVAEGFVWSD